MTTVSSNNYLNSKKVLVFNQEKILISIVRSTQTAARMMNLKTQSISFAANGKLISTGKHYFRYIPDDIEVDISDIGTLNLIAFDQLCGVERRVFKTRKMKTIIEPSKIKKYGNTNNQ